jgi:hypothetical protein
MTRINGHAGGFMRFRAFHDVPASHQEERPNGLIGIRKHVQSPRKALCITDAIYAREGSSA